MRLAHQRLLTYFLCFALFLKVVVPVGFMPDLDALQQGVFKITICSSYGAQEILVDKNLKEIGKAGQHNNNGKQNHDVCPFGAAPQAALVFALIIFALTSFYILQYSIHRDRWLIQQVSIAPWARGPPL